LPHDLVAAFRATLEEVVQADFLLHVVDASHPRRDIQREAVAAVLEELGAGGKPVITVLNKSDLVADQYALRHEVANTPHACYVSAVTSEGLPALMDCIADTLRSLLVPISAVIPYDRSELVAQCYELGRVRRADYEQDGIHVSGDVTAELAGRLRAALGKDVEL
jgi:GTP-binding protein HflX